MELTIKWDDQSKDEHFDYRLEFSGKQALLATVALCGTVLLGKALFSKNLINLSKQLACASCFLPLKGSRKEAINDNPMVSKLTSQALFNHAGIFGQFF